jgi:hypothetical protein
MADGRTRLRKAEDEIAELRAEVEALRAAQNVHLGHGYHGCCHCWHGHVHWYPTQGAAGGCYPYYDHGDADDQYRRCGRIQRHLHHHKLTAGEVTARGARRA